MMLWPMFFAPLAVVLWRGCLGYWRGCLSEGPPE